MKINITSRDLATILAALSYVHFEIHNFASAAEKFKLMPQFTDGDIKAMSTVEINELCERINTTGEPDAVVNPDPANKTILGQATQHDLEILRQNPVTHHVLEPQQIITILATGLTAVEKLTNSCSGVWRLNNDDDQVPWDDLRPGGGHDWRLKDFYIALALAKNETDQSPAIRHAIGVMAHMNKLRDDPDYRQRYADQGVDPAKMPRPTMGLYVPSIEQRRKEGWDIFACNGGWQVQADEELGIITGLDRDAVALKLAGKHQVLTDADGYLVNLFYSRLDEKDPVVRDWIHPPQVQE